MLTLGRTANPLVFPGYRLAGLDPTHPAARGISGTHGFSCVASGSRFFNLITPPATITPNSTVTAAMVGSIGPAVDFSTNTSSLDYFPLAVATDVNATLACIIQLESAASGYRGFVQTASSAGGAGWILQVRADSGFTWSFSNNAGSTIFNSAVLPTPVANVPFFFVGSVSASTINLLLGNLQTGQVYKDSVSGATIAEASGNGFALGNYAANSGGTAAHKMAAAMFSPTYLSMPQLLQWAQDPWAFWYPPAVEQLAFNSGTIQAAASTNPVYPKFINHSSIMLGAAIAASRSSPTRRKLIAPWGDDK